MLDEFDSIEESMRKVVGELMEMNSNISDLMHIQAESSKHLKDIAGLLASIDYNMDNHSDCCSSEENNS